MECPQGRKIDYTDSFFKGVANSVLWDRWQRQAEKGLIASLKAFDDRELYLDKAGVPPLTEEIIEESEISFMGKNNNGSCPF
jgi:hypothetical protein